eukprot:scaffold105154_cov44-Attheya_sp.AAC.1
MHVNCLATSAPLEVSARSDASCADLLYRSIITTASPVRNRESRHTMVGDVFTWNAGRFCQYFHGVSREISLVTRGKISLATGGTILPSQVQYVQASGWRRGAYYIP